MCENVVIDTACGVKRIAHNMTQAATNQEIIFLRKVV